MRTRSIVLTLVLCVFAAAVCFAAAAASPHMGTWKLNEAKSKIAPSMGKNITVVYAAAGDSVKITVDGVDGSGKPAHNEWTGKFDGRDYPVTGDPNSDMRSYSVVDANTLHAVNKKAGKVTADIQVVVSADGKSRTVTVKGTDAKGAAVTSTSVYDKQ